MANPHRGEVAVTLGDREYVMRPTFEAMAQIEEELGAGLVAIASRLHSGQYGARDVAAVLIAGIKAERGRMRRDTVQNAIVAQGVLAFAVPVATFLGNCLTGGAEPGEATAAESGTS